MRIDTDVKICGAEHLASGLHSSLSIDVVFGDSKSMRMTFSGKSFRDLCKVSDVPESLTNELIHLITLREDIEYYRFGLNSNSEVEKYKGELKTLIRIFDIFEVNYLDDSEIDDFYLNCKLGLKEDEFKDLVKNILAMHKILTEKMNRRKSDYMKTDFNIEDELITLVENPIIRIEKQTLSSLKRMVFDHMMVEGTTVIDYNKKSVLKKQKSFVELSNQIKELETKEYDFNNNHHLDEILDLVIKISKHVMIRVG